MAATTIAEIAVESPATRPEAAPQDDNHQDPRNNTDNASKIVQKFLLEREPEFVRVSEFRSRVCCSTLGRRANVKLTRCRVGL